MVGGSLVVEIVLVWPPPPPPSPRLDVVVVEGVSPFGGELGQSANPPIHPIIPPSPVEETELVEDGADFVEDVVEVVKSSEGIRSDSDVCTTISEPAALVVLRLLVVVEGGVADGKIVELGNVVESGSVVVGSSSSPGTVIVIVC